MYIITTMCNALMYFFLLIFSITDLRYQKVPNELVIMMAVAGAFACGIRFVYVFAICLLILGRIRIRGRTLFGGGDIKVISILCGMLGIYKTLIILFISLLLSLISFFINLIISKQHFKESLKTRFPFIPYLMGGFLCAGLFHL